MIVILYPPTLAAADEVNPIQIEMEMRYNMSNYNNLPPPDPLSVPP